jgi:hypothetical protein
VTPAGVVVGVFVQASGKLGWVSLWGIASGLLRTIVPKFGPVDLMQVLCGKGFKIVHDSSIMPKKKGKARIHKLLNTQHLRLWLVAIF